MLEKTEKRTVSDRDLENDTGRCVVPVGGGVNGVGNVLLDDHVWLSIYQVAGAIWL